MKYQVAVHQQFITGELWGERGRFELLKKFHFYKNHNEAMQLCGYDFINFWAFSAVLDGSLVTV